MAELKNFEGVGDQPRWLARTLREQAESCWVEVDGTSIHYLAWNREELEKPSLLLVHGYRAHARWWDFIAPFLTANFRVVALDLSGMGDSGHRLKYTPLTGVKDILAVIEDANLGVTTLVGHSFGGSRVLRTCVEAPECVKQAIVIDTFVLFGEERLPNVAPPSRESRPYPDEISALERFRLMPDQPYALPSLVSYVAKHSLHQTELGWFWKFDRALPQRVLEPDEYELFAGITVPVDVICGENSVVVSEERALRTVEAIPHARGPVVIPEGYHHVMLSQPIALISVLRALLRCGHD